MPTVYYRTEDPVENLKIRVVVREIAKSRIYNEYGAKIQPFYNEMTLSWQQKLYSPGEISDYLRRKDHRSTSAAQVEARRHFAKLEKDGDNVKEMLEEVMLYTYVDKDNFMQHKPPPLFDPGTQEPYLGAAVRTLGGVHRGDAREKSIANKLFRDKPFKSMYICLATDVDGQKLSEPASIWVQDKHFNEHVLCSIKLYQDGLLEVSPSFSSVIEEAGFLTHDDFSGLSAFMDDHSAETGLKKGFRLATFRVRSAKGSEFEYAIQNVNDILIPYKLEQIEAKKAFLNSIKAAEVRGTVGAEAWMQDPPSRDKTVGIYGEIVSGKGFEGERLFISYELTTPHNWLLRTGDLSDGVANTKPAAKDAVSAEQQELKVLGRKVRTEGDEGMLRGVTHTATAMQTLRTSTTLPQLRPRWKGVHVAFAAGTVTRIVFGTAFFGISCFSIILGASYPFWIVPALMIVFVLGTGMPGQPQQVVLLKRKSGPGASASTAKYAIQPNRLGYSNKDREVVGDLEPPLVAVFNHLMRFSFDVNDVDPAAGNHVAPSAHMPTLVFQVFSTDWLGRHRLEGYGYHHLSDKPGTCDVEIKTWRPVGKIRDQMRDFFLGNAVYLKDEHFVDSVNKTAAALNRFGVLTQTAGSVRLRVHTIVTDPRTIEVRHRENAEAQQQVDSSLKVKRTVNDILKSFRASSQGTPGKTLSASNSAASMAGLVTMAALGTPGKPGPGGRPSVANIMGSINASARDAKMNEILARARAKGGKGGAVKPEGIAAAPRPVLGPPTVAAMERLKQQLPVSSFGTPGPGAGVVRPQATPMTPGVLAAASNVDTPFATEPKQAYDPHIDRPRPQRVPKLDGIGGGASSGAPSGPVPMGPLTGSSRSGTASGAGSGRPALSSRPSAHSTARDAKQATAGLLEPDEGQDEVGFTSGRSAPSEPSSVRKHRYDPKAASEDEGEAGQALLGTEELAPSAQRTSLESSGGLGIAGASLGSEGLHGDEDEDAPLLATLNK